VPQAANPSAAGRETKNTRRFGAQKSTGQWVQPLLPAPRGAVEKKMTKATYICRSAKKNCHLHYFIFIFIFIFIDFFKGVS
jgi:hypothetical protein